MEKADIDAMVDERLGEDISKAAHKKKQRELKKRQRKHKVLSPAQKRALKKASLKSKSGTAKMKRKKTSKQRKRRGVYDSLDGVIDNVLEARKKGDDEDEKDKDKKKEEPRKITEPKDAKRPEDADTGKSDNESVEEARATFKGDIKLPIDMLVKNMIELAKVQIDLGRSEDMEVSSRDLEEQIEMILAGVERYVRDKVYDRLAKKKIMVM